jgi:hypothetical protein
MSDRIQQPRKADTRREVKFVAYSSELHRLENWLRLHRAGFTRLFPPRWVNNLYFDDFDYAAFAENLTGGSERVKVRYRWYGQSAEPTTGNLEVKMKRNVFGWKLQYAVNQSPYRAGATWRSTIRELRSTLPEQGRVWLDHNPMPVLINRYYRRYLMSSDGTTRVTIDTGQAVWDQRLRARPNLVKHARLPDAMVVEFKFSPDDRNTASEMLRDIPIRVSRNSKYVQGLAAIAGR